MKKCLLFNLAMGISGIMLAQSVAPQPVTPAKLKSSVANRAAFYKKGQLPGSEATPSFSAMATTPTLKPYQNPALKAYTTTIIGNTGYQLQTNSSICNRVIVGLDGTIAATWTMSQLTDGAWADRGTGYNYYNGTAWGASPTVRVENIRTGFTNVGWTTTNQEFVVTHEASNIHVASRTVKGVGAWTDGNLGYPDVWSRMVVGGTAGNSIHVISQTKGTANPMWHGQDGGISYTRSQDGGMTWDKVRSMIPPLDSSNYRDFGGDAYAMDIRGNTIAVVAGGFEQDVVLAKSTDNGNTWTKTVVKMFPIPMFDESTMLSDVTGDGVADTIETNDASVEVLLDNAGNAHVWYGNMRMLNDDMTDGGVSYFPGTDGLFYWNEGMGATAPVMIAASEDIDGDMILNVTDWGTYQVSLTSHPSAGIAADGKIYLSYAGIYEGDADGGGPGVGKSYRHTYVMRSDDGGINWCDPIDVTDPGGVVGLIEGVYGAMAPRVDTHVHLLVQQDGSVGHGVSTTTSPDPQSGMADLIYTKIPVADLACGVGINESSQTIVTELFPNPASNSATLVITSTERNQASVKIYNSIGKLVSQSSNDLPNAGAHRINLNLEKFSKGIYFVNVNINGRTATQKLIVE